MAKNVIQYDLLISCPGDITDEVNIIEKVVGQFNQQYSGILGISIRSRYWLKSSYPQSGGKPQGLLNKQFVEDCDAAIAIFWTRFGTPTDKYESGSEEEIEMMLNEGKQVFLYFSEKKITPSNIDANQYQKVIAFKNKYKENSGVIWTYPNDMEFEKLLFAHLSQYFLTVSKISEIELKSKSELLVKSVHNGQLYDTAYIEKFNLQSNKNSNDIMNDISNLFRKISSYHKFDQGKVTLSPTRAFQFIEPVVIKEETIKYIKEFAKQMQLNIAEDFFSLGNLSKNTLTSILGSGQDFIGTVNEKRKYTDIIVLKELINDILNWIPIEENYKDLQCITFVLSNTGTAYDEDIDIALEFNSDMLLPNIPIPKESSLKYICDKCSLSDLFGIRATSIYMDYDSSKKPLNYQPTKQKFFNPFEKIDYEEEYINEWNKVFEYLLYKQDKSTIVKLHIDYIKQHTAVAFPAPIFVGDKHHDIKYNITSKHNPEIVSGIIKLSSNFK